MKIFSIRENNHHKRNITTLVNRKGKQRKTSPQSPTTKAALQNLWWVSFPCQPALGLFKAAFPSRYNNRL